MKTTPFLSFEIDKNNREIIVSREFAADKDLVWKAWTTSEILDKWWAPKPYKAVTKSMDFSVGGFWLYYMLSPEGVKHFCRADYESIVPLESYSALDAFCDEEGNVDTSFPRMKWYVGFESKQDATMVNILITFENVEDLQKIIEMGFKEGFTMGMSNLDEVLPQI